MRQANKQESVIHSQGKMQAAETAWWEDPAADLVEKDFKTTIINIFKQQKETVLEEVK